MKHVALSISTKLFCVLAAVGAIALPGVCAAADDDGFNGATYIITIKDAQGAFASRGVMTLHADHSMSVIDSGQGGPSFFFSRNWVPGRRTVR